MKQDTQINAHAGNFISEKDYWSLKMQLELYRT